MNQQNLNFRTTPLAEEMRPHFLKYSDERLKRLREAMEKVIEQGDTGTGIRLLSIMRRVNSRAGK